MPNDNGKILVKTHYNWADEADFDGFEVMTETELAKAKAVVKKFFDEHGSYEFYVGTNEAIDFDDFDDIFGRHVKITPLTEAEAKVIEKLFDGKYGYPTLSRIAEALQEKMAEDEL